MDSSSCSRVTSESTSNNSSDRKRVIDELTRGRLMTDELRAIIRQTKDIDASAGGGSFLSAGALVQKILDSFADSISILTTSAAAVDSDAEVSQIPALKSEAPSPGKTPKDRRGCYKRRRTSETETRETPSPFEDGHAWRKYGQKVILNAIHPRNYFRCTHKYDQGCQATKQVQKIQDDLFRTTYHSHHTCKNLIVDSPHQIIMDAAPHDSSIIWSFQSHKQVDTNTINDAAVVINPVVPAVKKEGVDKLHYNYQTKVKTSSSNDHDYNNFIGAHDQFLTYDGHESVPLSAFSSGSDHGDVYSCTASNHSMDMPGLMAFDDLPEF